MTPRQVIYQKNRKKKCYNFYNNTTYVLFEIFWVIDKNVQNLAFFRCPNFSQKWKFFTIFENPCYKFLICCRNPFSLKNFWSIFSFRIFKRFPFNQTCQIWTKSHIYLIFRHFSRVKMRNKILESTSISIHETFPEMMKWVMGHFSTFPQ